MIGGQVFNPGMGGGASAPLPRNQQGGPQVQANIQQQVPNQGQFNGNPNGAYNQGFTGQGNAPAWQQQTNLGRYRPPTMRGGNGQWNSNVWNDFGGYDYNLPGSYGSPMGQGQFAPMLNQFRQQFGMAGMTPNFFGMGNPFGGFGMGRRAPMPGMGRDSMIDYEAVRRDPRGFEEWYQEFANDPRARDANPEYFNQVQRMRNFMQGQNQQPQPTPPGMGGGASKEDFDEADFQRWLNEGNAPMRTTVHRSPEEQARIREQDRQLYLESRRQPTPPGKDGNPLPAPMPAPMSPRDPRRASPGWSQSFLNTLLNPPRPPQTGGTTGMMPDPEGGLQNAPVAPMPRFSGRGAVEGFGGPDSDEARFRNLAALRAMMGGG